MLAVWNVAPPDEDNSKNYALLVVSVLTFSLAAATTCLRAGTRLFRVRSASVGWDDCAIILATVSQLVHRFPSNLMMIRSSD